MESTDVNPWGKSSKKHSKSGKLTKKMSQKTKSVAKKLKAGASSGVSWLKIKLQIHKFSKNK
ncbi:hypothetical protein HanRHA438_Chr17g0805271 [Helianthus annuus]|nr:hypothetical protein HanIR_Chr17g0862671 [Helianthus annuus]KAJ0825624.1 hypothetical protein HanRHA438_Chr17g0805271 [Helianthus annuus]